MHRTQSPAPKAQANAGQKEMSAAVAEKRKQKEKAIATYQKKCEEDSGANTFCFCIGLLFYLVAAFTLWWSEFSVMCDTFATARALELHVEVGCDGSGVKEAADKKLPMFVSCPLDTTSFTGWQPEQFGFKDFKGGFSLNASWANQEVAMYQCVEKKVTHTEGTYPNEDTMKRVVVTTYAYEYSLGWFHEPVNSDGFKGVDGALFSADAQSKEAMHAACGVNFKGNPHFPAGMKTDKRAAPAITMASGKIDISNFPVEMHDVPLNPEAHAPSPYRHLKGGTALVSCDLDQPTVGCLHISYKQSTLESVSILAMPVQHPHLTVQTTYTMEKWQEQEKKVGEKFDGTCKGSVFTQVLFLSPKIGTVGDIVAKHMNQVFWTVWQLRSGFAICALIGLWWVQLYFPSCVCRHEDADVKYWYNVEQSKTPLGPMILMALMVLGVASWVQKDGLLGKVGVGASAIGHIVALSTSGPFAFFTYADEGDEKTAQKQD